jgi:hypothetical protein
VIPTLPLAARNRLAALVLRAAGTAGARQSLATLRDPEAARAWLGEAPAEHVALLTRRAAAAVAALAPLPLATSDASLADVLEIAGALFDAGLGFEVHELLEARWAHAEGDLREALQGLIQVAVGYQHAANGNPAGARALLAEGAARIAGRHLDGGRLEVFARAVRETLNDPHFGPRPAFPRAR